MTRRKRLIRHDFVSPNSTTEICLSRFREKIALLLEMLINKIGVVAAPRKTQFTNCPDPPAPTLICPDCDRRLIYERSAISGTKTTERWDHFECPECRESFEYRHRTRRLRRVVEAARQGSSH
jgi:hypothetical protein